MLANNLAKLGRVDEAVHLGRDACKKGERLNQSESFMRWRDFAALLLTVKKPAQALYALNQSAAQRELSHVHSDALARHRLMEAECFWALGDAQSANEGAREAEQLITLRDLWYLQAELRCVVAPM